MPLLSTLERRLPSRGRSATGTGAVPVAAAAREAAAAAAADMPADVVQAPLSHSLVLPLVSKFWRAEAGRTVGDGIGLGSGATRRRPARPRSTAAVGFCSSSESHFSDGTSRADAADDVRERSVSTRSAPVRRSELGDSLLLQRFVEGVGELDEGRVGVSEAHGEVARLDWVGESRPSTPIEEMELALLAAQKL